MSARQLFNLDKSKSPYRINGKVKKDLVDLWLEQEGQPDRPLGRFDRESIADNAGDQVGNVSLIYELDTDWYRIRIKDGEEETILRLDSAEMHAVAGFEEAE